MPTGKELETIPYPTERVDDGLLWGDYAMGRIEPCNRVDRFLAGVAYLDGSKPFAIFARGYYTRSTLAAYSWNGKRLSREWFVDPGRRGVETWALGLRSASGEKISRSMPGTNASIKWAADMTTRIVSGDRESVAVIQEWDPVLKKSEAVLSTDGNSLRIYTSTELTDRKLYTLMHDRQYRADVARQNSGYNQPAHTGFYFASDIDWSKVPLRINVGN